MHIVILDNHVVNLRPADWGARDLEAGKAEAPLRAMRSVRCAKGDEAGTIEVEAPDRHAVPGIDGERNGTPGGAGFQRWRLAIRAREDHASVACYRRVRAFLNGGEAAATSSFDSVGGSFRSKGGNKQDQ